MLSLVEVELWVLPIKTLSCFAEVAQLVAQLICNQSVMGSSPFFGSRKPHTLLTLGVNRCGATLDVNWQEVE